MLALNWTQMMGKVLAKKILAAKNRKLNDNEVSFT